MARRAGALALAVFFIASSIGFVALGSWQVQRRTWKLDLIERVESRAHAAPVSAPPASLWPDIDAVNDEYRKVRVTGVFRHERETLVNASTELGSGFWVLTPMQMNDGTDVLVNRGFVPPNRRDRATRAATQPRGEVTVTGLLRIGEVGHGLIGYLRRDDPAADRWYWRDVKAIGAARGLQRLAPYFIDAEATPDPSGTQPVGGLTVISFPNNHLVYALTWFALAAMAAAGAWRVLRVRS